MRFPYESLTSPAQRVVNEDFLGSRPLGGGRLWALADGLGGQGGGRTAAEVSVLSALGAFPSETEGPSDRLVAAAQAAHRAVTSAQSKGQSRTMSTTLVLLHADGDLASWCHVGDSRLYLFRDGAVFRRTLDHSLPQKLVDRGELEASGVRFHPERNMLLQAIGMGRMPEIPVDAVRPLLPGDAFLLCSDGFWEMVLEKEMEEDLRAATSPAEWMRRMETRLRALLEDWPETRSPADNYSAITVFVEDDGER